MTEAAEASGEGGTVAPEAASHEARPTGLMSSEQRTKIADMLFNDSPPEPEVAPTEDAPVEDEHVEGEPVADADAAPDAEQAEVSAEAAPEEPRKADAAARAARALVDLEKEKASRLRTEKRLRELEAKLQEAASDPQKALALAKSDPESFIQMMLDGKIAKEAPPKTPEEIERDEMRATLDELKRERDEAIATSTKRRELDWISEQIKERDVVSAFPWAAERIHAAYYDAAQNSDSPPDFAELVDNFEQHVVADLKNALSSERTLRKVLAAHPQAKDVLIKALGLSKAPEDKSPPARQETARASATGDGPSTLTQKTASEVPTRHASDTRPPKERLQRSVDLLISRG